MAGREAFLRFLVYIEDAERWREAGDILGVEVIRDAGQSPTTCTFMA